MVDSKFKEFDCLTEMVPLLEIANMVEAVDPILYVTCLAASPLASPSILCSMELVFAPINEFSGTVRHKVPTWHGNGILFVAESPFVHNLNTGGSFKSITRMDTKPVADNESGFKAPTTPFVSVPWSVTVMDKSKRTPHS